MNKEQLHPTWTKKVMGPFASFWIRKLAELPMPHPQLRLVLVIAKVTTWKSK